MPQHLRITLYTKSLCSLCDKLKADLDALGREDALRAISLEVHEMDIETDPDLYEKFQYLIPVLELPNEELYFPPHDYVSLYNALQRAAKANRTKPNRTKPNRTKPDSAGSVGL